MPLVPGTHLGSYEVIAPLGAGGMGEVYRAHDSRLGRDIAIKLLPESLASSPDRLARFEREAKTVANLNHPNIVTLHSFEDVGGVRFLTMELVEGRDLTSMIVPGGLPLAQVLDVAIPLADALVAAHERRVVHRDLKPANVMLTRDGRVKVLDFGLAKLMEIGADLELTRAVSGPSPISESGTIVGTAPYMAPEQIRGEEVDARTDLFSFGILVYELATGRRPFTGRTVADVSSAILRDQVPSLANTRADIPPNLEHLVERCLEKHPRERVQTALDVANELRSVKRTLERGSPAPPKSSSEKVASVAVLPFVNRSASADDEYFSDGLADELLNVLAKIKGLRVIARASAFQFKGKNEDIPTIGSKLNVATVLDGSVRKAGNRIRVSVQLVNVANSSPLWSETYDRTLDDIFAVQDDIAQSVVKELRSALLGEDADSQASGEAKAEVARATKGRATDPEAYRLCLLARHLIDRATREDTALAIEYLKKSLGHDAEFALAWAQLGSAYVREANMNWIPRAEGYGKALEAANRSLALEPDLAEGHVALGWVRMMHDWDWRGAESSLSRALELAPGNAEVLLGVGVLAYNQARLEEAIALHRRALGQDPLSPGAYFRLGAILFAVDRFVETETNLRKVLELAPQRVAAHGLLSLSLVAQNRREEALLEANREPSPGYRLWALAIAHDAMGHPTESDAALRELIERNPADNTFQIAEVHAARGEVEQAFQWLERAITLRDPGLADTKVSPHLRSLHGDPRWGVFLKKMGFEV